METAVCYLCDVLLKAQLAVKVYAKISNNFTWLDDVATDGQAEYGLLPQNHSHQDELNEWQRYLDSE